MVLCKCEVCGSNFEAKRSDAKYCSIPCKKVAHLSVNRKSYQRHIEKRRKLAREYAKNNPRPSKWKKVNHEARPCIHCGEVFIPKRSDKVSCGKRDLLHRLNEKQNFVKLTCSFCGREFNKLVGDYNRNVRNGLIEMYCSSRCAAKSKYLTLTCSTCGKVFEKVKSRVYGKNFVFCCRECQDANVDYILTDLPRSLLPL